MYNIETNRDNKTIQVSTSKHHLIDLFELTSNIDGTKHPKWGVNWPAKGTVTVKEAEVFVRLLTFAISKAKENNAS